LGDSSLDVAVVSDTLFDCCSASSLSISVLTLWGSHVTGSAPPARVDHISLPGMVVWRDPVSN